MTGENRSKIRRFTGGDGEVMDWLRSNRVEKVRVEWMDMHGIPRGKRVSLHTFDELRHKGVPFAALLFAIDLQARWLHDTRFGEEISFGDFYAVPDLSSMRLLRHEPDTALCLTNLHWADGNPIAEDPRNLLKKGLDQLKELGFTAYAAPEFEFYYLTSDFQLSDTGENAYAMLKRWGYREEEQALIDAASAHVNYEACNYEYGPGQFEITVEYGEAKDIADAGHLFRATVKETALAMGRRVTFMAKPYTEVAGSSCHLHFSLANEDGSNAFADENDPLKISQTCRHFIGGVLAHLEELATVFLPYPNSCKRIAPESFAPISIAWGMDNRVAAVRAINVTPKGTRIELRVPGGDICLHLGLAALIAAGLDGIKNQLDPGPPAQGHLDLDASVPKITTDWSKLLDHFDNSAWIPEAMGREFFELFGRLKRMEHQRIITTVVQEERDELIEMI